MWDIGGNAADYFAARALFVNGNFFGISQIEKYTCARFDPFTLLNLSIHSPCRKAEDREPRSCVSIAIRYAVYVIG